MNEKLKNVRNYSALKEASGGKGGEATLGKNISKADCGCDLGWPESIY